jgi:ClpP class serine protease
MNLSGARDHRCDGGVDMARQNQRVVGRQPIGQQFRHGREHLTRDAHLRHGLEAALDVPALVGDGAEVPPVDHHAFMVAVVRGRHLRPMRAAMLAGIGREFRRHDVGVDVDGGVRHGRSGLGVRRASSLAESCGRTQQAASGRSTLQQFDTASKQPPGTLSRVGLTGCRRSPMLPAVPRADGPGSRPMTFDFSSLIWIVIAILALQPLLTTRWYTMRRAQAIRAIEKAHGTRVITMIHRQEKRSLFGFSVFRHIDLEDAQAIIGAIKETPTDVPIDLVLHTPGGLVIAAMQIARAVEAHPAKTTVYVPIYAMSGGTLIALAADEIVMGEFSMLGPIDPQIVGLPAASIVKARDSKPIGDVFDLTLVLADMGDKALAQLRRGAVELLTPRLEQTAAETLATKLTDGHWTHDYALTAGEAKELGLPVKVGIPAEVMQLMQLYPQPVQQSGVEFLTFNPTRRRS